MATYTRTSGLFLLLFLLVNTSAASPPWIFSVIKECVGNKCGVSVISSDVIEWGLTGEIGEKGAVCSPPANKYTESNVELEVPSGTLFFCARGEDNLWYHQGDGVYLSPNDVTDRLVQFFEFGTREFYFECSLRNNHYAGISNFAVF